jgi:hypothetical protein
MLKSFKYAPFFEIPVVIYEAFGHYSGGNGAPNMFLQCHDLSLRLCEGSGLRGVRGYG